MFFDPGPGGSGAPREVPEGPPWAFPVPPGASRRPPGPKTNQSKKPRNLKELTERWSHGWVPGISGASSAGGGCFARVAVTSDVRDLGQTRTRARPLRRALQKVLVFMFFDPGPGGSEGPREGPEALRGPFRCFRGSRRPPGPKTNQSKKPRNLKELIKQMSEATTMS